MGYRLTDEAELDLIAIYDFGADVWGDALAISYFHKLHAQFDKIASDPERFPEVDHIKPGYRRSVFKAHSIYFKIEPEGVGILRILRSQSTSRLK